MISFAFCLYYFSVLDWQEYFAVVFFFPELIPCFLNHSFSRRYILFCFNLLQKTTYMFRNLCHWFPPSNCTNLCNCHNTIGSLQRNFHMEFPFKRWWVFLDSILFLVGNWNLYVCTFISSYKIMVCTVLW